MKSSLTRQVFFFYSKECLAEWLGGGGGGDGGGGDGGGDSFQSPDFPAD